MRMLSCRATLGLLLLTAAAPTPRPATERDAVFANRSDRTINEIYASPSASEEWGPDRLGDVTIEPKQSRRIALGPARDCLFDVQIVYSDASREERRRVDICRTRLLAFDASDALAPAGAEGGDHLVVIANQTSRPIQQVLISPAESGDWGDDRLTNSSISAGDSETVTYRGSCLADLRVVYDNRSAEERRGLDLCALGGVAILPGWTFANQPTPAHPPDHATPVAPLTMTVVNHAGRTIRELYVYPDMSGATGPDLLGAAPLEDAGQVTLDILRPQGACRFAARVVYGGKVPSQDLTGLDLCHEPTLIVPPRS